MADAQPPYLYLTTTGWKSGSPHEIEIWFVERAGRYYLAAEHRQRAHWVQNIQRNPAVAFRVGSRTAPPVSGAGRVVNHDAEPELVAAVSALMSAKYGWDGGLFVELTPSLEAQT